jgi:hypothetical protein
MKLAKMDGWDLVDGRGEPWPWYDLEPPAERVRQSHFQAFVLAKEIFLKRTRCAKDKKMVRPKFKPSDVSSAPSRPAFKSWIEFTIKDN